MKLVGLMPVRNESWCLGLTARAALLWCDHLIITLHACTDASLEIILEVSRENPDRVSWFSSGDPKWDEMSQRQELLSYARLGVGVTHIAIVDADEILCGNLLPQIRRHVESIPAGFMLHLPGYNLRHGIHQYHSSGTWGRRWFSAAFKDDPRANWAGDTFHHREPLGISWRPYRPLEQPDGGILHLWGASERRLIAKHALYKVTEKLRWPEKAVSAIDLEYSQAIKGRPHMGEHPANWRFQQVPDSWWAPYLPWLKYLDLEQEPWQERHVQALVKQHSRERFDGLDLFGVA